jgi:hypothetical protein
VLFKISTSASKRLPSAKGTNETFRCTSRLGTLATTVTRQPCAARARASRSRAVTPPPTPTRSAVAPS